MTGDQRPSNFDKQLTERLDIDLALQAAGLGVWEVDLLTNQVRWDQRCSQLFGIDRQQFSFSDTLHHIHPGDIGQVNQAVQWALNPQSDGTYQVTYRCLGQDGRTHWIRSTGQRYVDQTGQPIRLAGVSQNLTEQVEARQREDTTRQQSEARFRTLIEEAPVATCLFVGPDMRIEIANQAMIQVWGKGSDVIGLPLAEALPELKDQHFLTTLNELFATGNSYQARGGRADLVVEGQLQTFYFDYDFKPLLNSEGEVYAILETAIDVTSQMLAQQRIQQSQQELLALFEQAPVGIATLSSEAALVFQFVNPFYGELVGRSPSALMGNPLLEALPELRGQGFDQILREVIATGTPFVANEQLVQVERAGQLESIYVNYTYQPQQTADGLVSGVLAVITDVTQQVRSRKEVEASESKLRAILTTAPAGIGVFVGRELVIENPNQTFIDIVGKGPAIEGLPLREAMPELISEGQPFLQILDDILTTGEPFLSPSSLVRIVQNGVLTDNYYNISYSPIHNDAGDVYAILDIAIDVTQEVRARQQLQEAEASLREAVELAQLGTWSIDVASQGLVFSDRLIEWFGYDPKAQSYNEVIPILEAGDQERVDRAVAWALNPESDGVYNEVYTVIHPKTGHKRILHARGKAVFDGAGRAVRLNGTAQDITLQREMQLALEQQVQQRTEELRATNEELATHNEEYAAINEELEEANSLLNRSNENLQQFAYVASHDLQEPLRKIQQFGDLLKDRFGDQLGDGIDYLERMQSAANRMSRLIRDLLDFSRIATQRDTKDSVSLQTVVERVLSTLELQVEKLDAQIRVDLLPTVLGNSSQLGQLFQNLLSNALKFHRPGIAPSIEVMASLVAADKLPGDIQLSRVALAYHRIDVVDNGIGFDEKYLDRIFQVFQRLHGKNEFAGTGIGLAICEKVVTNHGGAITASSQPGQGAAFSVYLPV